MNTVTCEKKNLPMPTASLPTAQEVLAATESKHLYRTNLLRLQLDELLSNLSPSYEKLGKVDELIESIITAVRSVKAVTIPADYAKMYKDQKFHKAGLKDLEFEKPSSVDVIGSYKERGMIKPRQTVDIAVVMPASCFGEKDIKSYRYFDRRTAYCAELVSQLKGKVVACDFSVAFWQADRNKAVVLCRIPGSQWRVRLIPCVGPSTFSQTKLGPSHKNLEESTVCDALYNASILEDMYLMSDIFSCPRLPHFTRAVQLAAVWLHRRQALVMEADDGSSCACGFSGFHIRVLLSHLVLSQNLPREISAYQLFKLFISMLAKTEWTKYGFVYGSSGSKTPHPKLPYPLLECAQLSNYNPLWRLPLSLMSELGKEAATSLTLLDDSSVTDPYEELFCPVLRARDFIVVLTLSSTNANARKVVDQVESVLKQGLGSRLFSSGAELIIRHTLDTVTVSGDIDAKSANVVMDRGPSADSVEAVEFRAFWGSKSELRRFRDGSILECAVWKKQETKDDKSIAEQIISYLLESKFPSFSCTVSVSPLGACQAATGSHVVLWTLLETLRVKLTSIHQLPISVVSLRPAHAKFTATSPSKMGSWSAPLDCVIEFESSKNWPTSKLAVWHSKCAFLLAIREGLVKQYCAVEIGAQNDEEPFLDIKMIDSPVCFRLRILANIELDRLNTQLGSVSTPPSLAEIASVAQLWFSPMLRARIHALTATCPALAGAAVLAKEWLDNHLLLEPYLGEWVEVTLAHVVEISRKSLQSPHALILEWFFFIANHATYDRTPIFASLGSDAVSPSLLKNKFDLSVEHRRSWWISSDIDPDCLFLRRPNAWEASRILTLAKSALVKADRALWDNIRFGTDNAKVYDMLLYVAPGSSNQLDDHVKVLRDHFRNYLCFNYSKRHGIIGVRFESSAFKPQHGTKMGSLCAIIDDVAVPDIPTLTLKLAALLKGGFLVKDIKIRS